LNVITNVITKLTYKTDYNRITTVDPLIQTHNTFTKTLHTHKHITYSQTHHKHSTHL